MVECKDIIEIPGVGFAVPCITCGKLKITKKRKNAVRSRFRNCTTCSNRSIENSGHKGWYKEVLSTSFVNGYIKSAKERHLEWAVTGDYLADLLISQEFKCSLSGIHIEAKKARKNTASLDRINSSLGYVEGNLQWLYSPINMMKQSYSQTEFISLCREVTLWNK